MSGRVEIYFCDEIEVMCSVTQVVSKSARWGRRYSKGDCYCYTVQTARHRRLTFWRYLFCDLPNILLPSSDRLRYISSRLRCFFHSLATRVSFLSTSCDVLTNRSWICREMMNDISFEKCSLVGVDLNQDHASSMMGGCIESGGNHAVCFSTSIPLCCTSPHRTTSRRTFIIRRSAPISSALFTNMSTRLLKYME